jgi:hypothetical protein
MFTNPRIVFGTGKSLFSRRTSGYETGVTKNFNFVSFKLMLDTKYFETSIQTSAFQFPTTVNIL